MPGQPVSKAGPRGASASCRFENRVRVDRQSVIWMHFKMQMRVGPDGVSAVAHGADGSPGGDVLGLNGAIEIEPDLETTHRPFFDLKGTLPGCHNRGSAVGKKVVAFMEASSRARKSPVVRSMLLRHRS